MRKNGFMFLVIGAITALMFTVAVGCSSSEEDTAPAAPAAASAAAPAAAPAPATKAAPAAKTTNVFGREMPSDAAPMAAQFLKVNYEKEGESLEFPVSV